MWKNRVFGVPPRTPPFDPPDPLRPPGTLFDIFRTYLILCYGFFFFLVMVCVFLWSFFIFFDNLYKNINFLSKKWKNRVFWGTPRTPPFDPPLPLQPPGTPFLTFFWLFDDLVCPFRLIIFFTLAVFGQTGLRFAPTPQCNHSVMPPETWVASLRFDCDFFMWVWCGEAWEGSGRSLADVVGCRPTIVLLSLFARKTLFCDSVCDWMESWIPWLLWVELKLSALCELSPLRVSVRRYVLPYTTNRLNSSLLARKALFCYSCIICFHLRCLSLSELS